MYPSQNMVFQVLLKTVMIYSNGNQVIVLLVGDQKWFHDYKLWCKASQNHFQIYGDNLKLPSLLVSRSRMEATNSCCKLKEHGIWYHGSMLFVFINKRKFMSKILILIFYLFWIKAVDQFIQIKTWQNKFHSTIKNKLLFARSHVKFIGERFWCKRKRLDDHYFIHSWSKIRSLI